MKKNWKKRTLGILISLSPLILYSYSIICYFQKHTVNKIYALTGLALVTIGSFITIINIYLTLRVDIISRIKKKPKSEIEQKSIIPIVGTLFAIFANYIALGSVTVSIIGCILWLVDTGGPFWFLYYTWNDSSLWDE